MNVEIVISLFVLFYQQLFILKIQAAQLCSYRNANSTILTTSCTDDCCVSSIAASIDTACCSPVSWSSLAIPFFVVAGVCILAICLIYCRPLWKVCLCGYKWPFGSRARVNSPDSTPPNNNPVYANNDDLPDYDTIVKDSAMKDPTPPPYTFVAAHPNDFGIEARITSAPPQYHSRRSSLATTDPATPVEI